MRGSTTNICKAKTFLQDAVLDFPDPKCRRAGIAVKMISGDNVETARAIASEIGLLDQSDAVVLSHAEFEAASDDKLLETMPHLRVLARHLQGERPHPAAGQHVEDGEVACLAAAGGGPTGRHAEQVRPRRFRLGDGSFRRGGAALRAAP